jgi:hypothetical protein
MPQKYEKTSLRREIISCVLLYNLKYKFEKNRNVSFKELGYETKSCQYHHNRHYKCPENCRDFHSVALSLKSLRRKPRPNTEEASEIQKANGLWPQESQETPSISVFEIQLDPVQL